MKLVQEGALRMQAVPFVSFSAHLSVMPVSQVPTFPVYILSMPLMT